MVRSYLGGASNFHHAFVDETNVNNQQIKI